MSLVWPPVTPGPDNAKSSDDPAPWVCQYGAGDAMILLAADWSDIQSSKGADAVAAAYSQKPGDGYETLTNVGVVNLTRDVAFTSEVVLWTGLAKKGDQGSELIVQAIVADESMSPEKRREIINTYAELYVSTVRMSAAMGE